MEKNNSYQYYVVEFTDPPHTGFDKYVCVPDFWMGLRDEETQTAVVKYPIEEVSVTKKRVKNKENFLRDWPFFEVYVKFGADTYRKAKNYIKLLHNVLLVTQGVENIDLKIPTPETKSKVFVSPNSKGHHNITNRTNLLKQEQAEKKCTDKNNTINEPPVSHDSDLTNESTIELSQKHLLNPDLLNEMKKMDSSIRLRCEEIENALHEHKKQSMLIKTMIKSMENFDGIFNDFIADISHSTIEVSVNDENTVIFNDLQKVVEVANKIARNCEDKESDVINDDDNVFVIDRNVQSSDDIRRGHGKDHDNNDQARTGNFVVRKRTHNTSSGSHYTDDHPQRDLENHQQFKNPLKVTPDSNLYVKAIQFSNCKKISKDSFYRFFY